MKTILIFLQSKIPAFQLSNEDLNIFQAYKPNYRYIIAKSEIEFKRNIPEAHFIVTWSFEKQLYEIAKKLIAIFTPAAGRDWIATDPNHKVNIHFGAFHGQMIFESFLGMMLNFLHQHKQAWKDKNNQRWKPERLPFKTLLKNQKILIIGYGKVGEVVARNLKLFGCKVYGLKKTPLKKCDQNATIFYDERELTHYLKKVDHVLLLLPKHSTTNCFFSKEYLLSMKNTAILYNFGRGNCLISKDILWALDNRIISGVGLDVFEQEPLAGGHPLWKYPNVFMTPHSACFYKEYMKLFISELISIWPSYEVS